MIQLILLGTGGTLPTVRRCLPCSAVQIDREILLFDCGEGAQLRYLQSGLRLNRPMRIFITHLHGDHILGLPGLLQTFSLLGRENPMEIYGPKGIVAYIRATIRTVKFHPSFPIKVKDIEAGLVVETAEYKIESVKANHSVPCFSYAFLESKRPGKFHPDKAIALGVEPGPLFRKLQQGNSIKIGREVVKPSHVMDRPRRGAKIVFSGDTYYSENLVALARKSDILIHECTFDDSLIDKAKVDKHSTPEIATQVANEAGVRKLILNHITQRYPDPNVLLDQAVSRFANTIIAEDLQRVRP